MFFDDTNRANSRYTDVLKEIAATQRKLLGTAFSWDGRKKLAPPKRGFLSRKPAEDPVRSSCLYRLENLKREAKTCCDQAGYTSGIQWWSIPWEQTEECLIFDLSPLQEHGAWRFEQTFKPLTHSGAAILTMREEGHFSSFSTQRMTESGIISDYTESEINAKMRRLKDKIDLYEYNEYLPDKRRYVGSQGVYDNGAAYVNSAEYQMMKHNYLTEYEQGMYQKRKATTLVAVSSGSIHYDVTYAIGAFHINGKRLADYQSLGFEVLESSGQLPDQAVRFYAAKDASVSLSAFLADAACITDVPVSVVVSDLTRGSASYDDARRVSEMLTCLQPKLVFE